jgi:hypothetical protein
MSKWARRGVWATVVALVVVYALWLVMTIALRSKCGNEVLQEIDSQDHRYTASVFERDCGATAPFVRVVSLRTEGTKLDTESRGDWILALRGQDTLQLRWASERHLVIGGATRDPKAQIRSSWLDVKVSLE